MAFAGYGIDVASLFDFAWGSGQLPNQAAAVKSGDGFEILAPTVDWGSAHLPYGGNQAKMGDGFEISAPTTHWGSYHKPARTIPARSGYMHEVEVYALPVTPGDTGQVIVVGRLQEEEELHPKMEGILMIPISSRRAIVLGRAFGGIYNGPCLIDFARIGYQDRVRL